MEFELKAVSVNGIPHALRKAHQYRLLNEPIHAESICRDVLETDTEHQQAIDILILALTDQFGGELSKRYREALALRARLRDPYRRAYLEGLVYERRALALYRKGGAYVGPQVYEGLLKAMTSYERAMALRPAGNDDSILRWNACVRIVRRYPVFEPEPVV